MTNQHVNLGLPNNTESLAIKLELVREARFLFGEDAARRLWHTLGFPDLSHIPKQECARDDVTQFITECVRGEPGREVAGRDMYDRYLAWSRFIGNDPRSLPAFGRRLSVYLRKKRRDRGKVYIDVRLVPIGSDAPAPSMSTDPRNPS